MHTWQILKFREFDFVENEESREEIFIFIYSVARYQKQPAHVARLDLQLFQDRV